LEESSSSGAIVPEYQHRWSLATKSARAEWCISNAAYFWQPEHLTQGQHYSFLAHWLSAEYNNHHTWLLFTDDDDIWHPQRAFYYQQVGQALLFLQFAMLSMPKHQTDACP